MEEKSHCKKNCIQNTNFLIFTLKFTHRQNKKDMLCKLVSFTSDGQSQASCYQWANYAKLTVLWL